MAGFSDLIMMFVHFIFEIRIVVGGLFAMKYVQKYLCNQGIRVAEIATPEVPGKERYAKLSFLTKTNFSPRPYFYQLVKNGRHFFRNDFPLEIILPGSLLSG